MAPVIKQLKQESRIESRVCVTAQHRYMLDQVLDLSQIKPAVDLNIMMDNQGLTEIGAAILSGLKPVLVMREKTERPEGVAAETAMLVDHKVFEEIPPEALTKAIIDTRGRWE